MSENPAGAVRLTLWASAGYGLGQKNLTFLNLTFHSTSLKAGSGSFVNSIADEKEFFKKLPIFFEHAQRAGWRSLTLAELEGSLQSK